LRHPKTPRLQPRNPHRAAQIKLTQDFRLGLYYAALKGLSWRKRAGTGAQRAVGQRSYAELPRTFQ